MGIIKTLEAEVARKLWDMGSPFHRDVPVNGLQTDFVLQPSLDRQVVLEVKDWAPTKVNVERARNQVALLKEATGTDDLYIVLPGKPGFQLPDGVISIDGLDEVIKLARTPGKGQMHVLDFQRPPTVFAAMPFSSDYDDVYYFAMREAAQKAGSVVTRVDLEKYEGDVVDKIHHMIDTAAGVIADLSESRPNVLYEVGYARGRKLDVVPLCCTDLGALPFDVRN
jgi:hypothetical protein